MNVTARSSSESSHGSGQALLNDFEKSENYAPYDTRKRRIAQWEVILPWTLCVVLLAAIVVQARIVRVHSTSASTSFWTPRELEIVKREVDPHTKTVRFTGGLRYNSTKQLYREIEESIPDYTGKPTDEITAAWHELISTTDIFLTATEIQEIIANGGTFANLPNTDDVLYTDPYSGLYQAVPTVFHDLHCLDKIRRGIYLDFYPQDDTEIFWPHIEHCLDTIRQSIMCHADMTPIPEAYTEFKPDGHLEPIFQIEHTCRDFDAIQRWAKGRDALDERVWRDNAERLKPGVWNQR